MDTNLNSEIIMNISLYDQDSSPYIQRTNGIKQERSRKLPKNSAKTRMPCFHNIDKEIEDLRVRNTRFDKSIDKELGKLNNPQYDVRFSLTGINYKPREFQKSPPKTSIYSGSNPYNLNPNNRRSAETNDTSQDESLFTKVISKRFHMKRNSLGTSNKKIRTQSMNGTRTHSPSVNHGLDSSKISFNQYVKSVPMHKDPRYSFSKMSDGKRSSSRQTKYKITRIDKLDNIMSSCSLVEQTPVNNMSDLRKHLRTAMEGMNEVKYCMSTIERAGDASADQDLIEEVKLIQRREQLLETWMKGHSLDMKEQNTAMSEFIHHLGKPKQLMWRFPGPVFPKKTEKLLNSLPTQRYGT